ncbi:MAG: crotonase/enoyl-CoA hydratase family protein [Pseudomonadota bacterium]|nr:crotonase/enoyl-CoA hydratase family protein [Pseudomonadota bacterium]
MTSTCFDLSIDNRIAHLRLIRPEKRNSMIPAFWDELPRIVRDIDHNVRARVIVISSTGPHFSAGLDIGTFLKDNSGEATGAKAGDVLGVRAALLKKIQYMQETFSSLEDCRIPVIAAIQGGCIGGGVDLVTACDMRYATADAFFTIFEINIGMTADVGTFPRLTRLIPEGLVRELAYTGRRMGSEEARKCGLLNRVYPDQETMLAEVMVVAAEIASKAPTAVFGSKRVINYSRDHATADVLDYIRVWNAAMLQPEEIIEAMAANAQKRPGEFAELPPAGEQMSDS